MNQAKKNNATGNKPGKTSNDDNHANQSKPAQVQSKQALNGISVVVPVFNEQDNVADLVQKIFAVLKDTNRKYELIMVDDGSYDDTLHVLTSLIEKYPGLTVIELRKNFGQTAALAAGFDRAQYEIIIPLDGDLQNDPADIPRLVAKLEEGYDVVSGWRKNRQDKLLTRKLPSWTANYLIGKITGVRLHDYGCTLKAYHRDALKNINLYGEMHRFIPAIASWAGARVTEMVVDHHPRTRGKTKYGLGRTFKVMLDLLTVKFLGSFSTRPLHIFGGIGFLAVFLACITGAVTIYQKLWHNTSMNRNPLLILTSMLLMMSVQFFLMGLLAEMLCRTYHESQNKKTYVIRRVITNTNSSNSNKINGENQ